MQPGDDRPVTAYPTVVPMLAYEDPGAALDWLAKAFGFRERLRLEMPDGRIGHAEMDVGENGVIMLATPSPDYEPPRKHRQTCARAAAWLAVPYVVDGVLVHVANVEEHMARARDAGATLLSELEDEPYGRLYRAEDLEGHRWMFMELPAEPASHETWQPPGEPSPE